MNIESEINIASLIKDFWLATKEQPSFVEKRGPFSFHSDNIYIGLANEAFEEFKSTKEKYYLFDSCDYLFEGIKNSDNIDMEDAKIICSIFHLCFKSYKEYCLFEKLQTVNSKLYKLNSFEVFKRFYCLTAYELLYKHWDYSSASKWIQLIFPSIPRLSSTLDTDLLDIISAKESHYNYRRREKIEYFSHKLERTSIDFASYFSSLSSYEQAIVSNIEGISSEAKMELLTIWLNIALNIKTNDYALFFISYLSIVLINHTFLEIIHFSANSLDEMESIIFPIHLPSGLLSNLPKHISNMLSCSKEATISKALFEQLKEVAFVYVDAKKIQQLLKVSNPDTLSYYTSYETLLFLLPHYQQEISRNSIKEEIQEITNHSKDLSLVWSFMNVAYMNDPNEGKTAKLFLGIDESTSKKKCLQNEYADIYLKSFTSRFDDLSMWEMYGDHARGCLISINWRKTCKFSAYIPPVYQVIYLSEGDTPLLKEKNTSINEHSLTEINKRLLRIKAKIKGCSKEIYPWLSFATEPLWYLIKDASYWHEAEKRIIYDESNHLNHLKYTGEKVPKLYFPGTFRLHIKEIVLGPKCQDVNEKVIFLDKQFGELQDAYAIAPPKISLSSIEYK